MRKIKCRIIGERELECDVDKIPISEKSILEECLSFYCDEDPCFIHRTAVKLRILAEIEKYFAKRCTESPQVFCSEDISEDILNSIDIRDIKKIIISI